MKIFKTITVSLIISICFSFLAFGEGMSQITGPKDTQVWVYLDDNRERQINQWKQFWDDWYYLGADGVTKYNTWAEIDGKWYYFDNFSRMLHDTTTPDGNTVGSDGVWVQ